jgi:hypothetical protein
LYSSIIIYYFIGFFHNETVAKVSFIPNLAEKPLQGGEKSTLESFCFPAKFLLNLLKKGLFFKKEAGFALTFLSI